MVQEVGDARGRDRRGAAPARARPRDRAQRVDAAGGQGRLRALGRRRPVAAGATPRPRPRPACGAAIAAKLGLPVDQVEVIAPDVGGGFGVKIVHPWPEEVLVPWAADAARPAGEVDRGPARALHLLRARARPGAARPGRLRRRRAGCSASTCEFWHDNGAYTPYGIIVPIITSTQLLGPYKPGAYRVEFRSLYTNTVIVTPYRGAGRPQGCLRDGAHDGRDRRRPRPGPGRWCGSATSSSPTRCPTTTGMIFQDGRPLIYDSGDFPALAGQAQGARRLGRLRGLPASRRGPRDAGSASGWPATSRAPASGPYEGGHVQVETDRQGGSCHRPHHPGPGPPDGVRADRRRRARRAVRRSAGRPPATPGGSSTPSARSPPGPR